MTLKLQINLKQNYLKIALTKNRLKINSEPKSFKNLKFYELAFSNEFFLNILFREY